MRDRDPYSRGEGSLIFGLAALALATGLQTSPPVVSGMVRDDAGTLIAGVIVAARRADPTPLINPLILSKPTDSSGRYTFDALPRGNYVFGVTIASFAAPMPPNATALTPGTVSGDATAGVTVIDRDGRTFGKIAGPVPAAESGRLTSLFAPVFHGGATVLPRAQLVQIDPDRPRTGIDIVLPRAAAVRIAGTLTVAAPRGATETGSSQTLVVRLLPADTPVMPPRGAASDAQPIATTIADASGAFVFPAVPAGEYVIDAFRPMPPPTVAVLPNGLPVVRMSNVVEGDPQGLAGAQLITLTRDVDQLSLTLRMSGPASRAAVEARNARAAGAGPPPGRIGGEGAGRGRALPGGTMGSGAIAGRLVDADGAPLAGVQIYAAQARGSELLPMGSPAITDADGRYRLGGVSPGSYAVVVPSLVDRVGTLDPVANAFPATASTLSGKTGYVTTFHPATTDPAAATLVEISGQDRDGIDIALQRVRVTELAGAIARASGYVFLVPDDRRARLGGRNVFRQRLSPDGQFLFRDIPDGRYLLSHDSPGGWARAAVALPETASAGMLQLSLQQHVSVSGRVVIQDDAAARGVSLPAGLTIRITPEQLVTGDSVMPGIVQPDGTFAVSRVVPGRRYFVRVTVTPPWRQTASSVYGQDAFSVPVAIAKAATDARIVITDR